MDKLYTYTYKKKLLQEAFNVFLSEETNPDISLKKNTSNLFRNRKNVNHKIDVRNFNEVISIDTHNLIAEIEGITTYEKIVNETLKYNCLPTVVPELKSITIGGALAGGGIESSSFRYGLAYETMLEYEVLTGNGDILLCTPINKNKDLFYGFPNSYGTLGYALKIKTQLIPAKKFVKLTHLKFRHPVEYFSALKQFCDSADYDFIDGVIFSKNEMYLTLANFMDAAPFTSNYKYLNIYYQSMKQKEIDYLNTKDYIWRWDTDWFWCSKHFYMQHFLMRFIFGKFLLNSISFWKLRHFFNNNRVAKCLVNYFNGHTESVIQDVEIPIDSAEAFLSFFQKEVSISPIWVCPIRSPHHTQPYPFYKLEPGTLYVNFGFWDSVATQFEDGFFNKKIESKVRELKGFKSLYSNIYYSEEEFWDIFDKNHYTLLKKVYDKDNKLKDLYQKCFEKT